MPLEGMYISRKLATNIIRAGMKGRWRWGEGNDHHGYPKLALLTYYVFSEAELAKFLRRSKVDTYRREPGFKCANFTAALYGDLATYQQRRGGPTSPYCGGFLWSGHALGWVLMIPKGKHLPVLRFIEAQTDWVLKPGTKRQRPGHWGVWLMVGQ